MQGFLKQPWSSITQQPSDAINPGLQTHTLSLQVFLLASVQSKFDWHSETREDKTNESEVFTEDKQLC